MPTASASREVFGVVLLKAIITALAAAVVAQLFLHFTHSTADPHVIAPAAGGAGFSIHGWRFVAPLLITVYIFAVVALVGLLVFGIVAMILAVVC